VCGARSPGGGEGRLEVKNRLGQEPLRRRRGLPGSLRFPLEDPLRGGTAGEVTERPLFPGQSGKDRPAGAGERLVGRGAQLRAAGSEKGGGPGHPSARSGEALFPLREPPDLAPKGVCRLRRPGGPRFPPTDRVLPVVEEPVRARDVRLLPPVPGARPQQRELRVEGRRPLLRTCEAVHGEVDHPAVFRREGPRILPLDDRPGGGPEPGNHRGKPRQLLRRFLEQGDRLRVRPFPEIPDGGVVRRTG